MNYIPKITYTELGTGTPRTITFNTPPEGDPLGEQIKGDVKTTETSNGNFQTQWNRNEEIFNLSFKLETLAIKTAVELFFKKHALKGGVFNYYKSNDETDYKVYRMVSTSIKFIRAVANSSDNDFFYNFNFNLKRTIDLTYESEGLGVGGINETQYDISEGVTNETIEGLSVDDSLYGAMFVDFYLYINTTGDGAITRSSAGKLFISRNNANDDWEITQVENKYIGIDFSIDNTGQVKYTSPYWGGTPNLAYIKFRADVFSQGS